MRTRNEYRELSGKVFDRLQAERSDAPSAINRWDWPTGVALYGLWQRYKLTGDDRELSYLRQWFDEKLDQPEPHRDVNSAGPLLTLCCLYDMTRAPRYEAVVRDWALWVMRDMPRTEYGGLQHCTVWNKHYQQLWSDTLFMTCLFLCKAGLTLGEDAYVEEAKYQFLMHIRYLQDRVTGLWRHGWTFDRRHSFAGAYWARGNAWFTSAAVELTEMLPARDATTRMIMSALQDQVLALWKLQRENGMFTTLLDVEESYCETSATAGIAYGVLKGVRLGLLDERYRDVGANAAEAVISRIDEAGVVGGVSGGTGMGHDLKHYMDIPIIPTPYGQGLTYLMLTELEAQAQK